MQKYHLHEKGGDKQCLAITGFTAFLKGIYIPNCILKNMLEVFSPKSKYSSGFQKSIYYILGLLAFQPSDLSSYNIISIF